MKDLSYKISIKQSKEEVWQVLLTHETYERWARAFSPKSTFKGEWVEGSEIVFWDPDMGGTTAKLVEFSPNSHMVLDHINTVTKDGVAETVGDMTEKWIGTKEVYRLSSEGANTVLTIEITTDAAFVEMFEKSWPKALEKIKELSENQV